MVQTKCGFETTAHAHGADLLTGLGPTLLVDIGFDPDHVSQSPAIPKPGITGVHALVDTGAGESCIDNLVASQLNLPIVDRRIVSGSNGSHLANVYLAQVRVPAIHFVIFGAFAGVDLKAGGQLHVALIGRTFLRHFTMTYEGRTGTVVISND